MGYARDQGPDAPHIHFVGDKHGPGEVFVDGVKVDWCFYADTLNGFVRYNLRAKDGSNRARINRRHYDVRWAKKRGKVEVKYIGGSWNDPPAEPTVMDCVLCGADMVRVPERDEGDSKYWHCPNCSPKL